MSSWTKLPFGQLMVKEFGRPGFFPFAVGGIFSFLVCGLGIQMTITDKDRAESKYYKQFVLGQK